jgi:Uma2 family endonuclease
MSALADSPMTEAEYLDFERTAEFKHEFLNGHVYAMSGASRIHNLICTNIVSALHPHLRDKPCEIYQSDMRIKVAATGLYTYPNITIVCGEPKFASNVFDTLLNPTLIIEVLSPSIESYDRGRKFHHYQQIESLQEYVLVTQDAPRIERFLRQQNAVWEYMEANGLNADLQLTSIGSVLALADAYAQVNFTPDDDSAKP